MKKIMFNVFIIFFTSCWLKSNAQQIVVDSKCEEYQCLSPAEIGILQAYVNKIKTTYNFSINVAYFSNPKNEGSDKALKDLNLYNPNDVEFLAIAIYPGLHGHYYCEDKYKIKIKADNVAKSNGNDNRTLYSTPMDPKGLDHPKAILCNIGKTIESFLKIAKNITEPFPQDCVNLPRPNLASNKPYEYVYDYYEGMILPANSPQISAEDVKSWELKTGFASEIRYVFPIPTSANLTRATKDNFIKELGKKSSLAVVYEWEEANTQKMVVNEVFVTAAKPISPTLPPINPNDRGYPTIEYLAAPDLRAIKEKYNGNNTDDIKEKIREGDRELAGRLYGNIALSGVRNGLLLDGAGGAGTNKIYNANSKAEVSSIIQWKADDKTVGPFKEKITSSEDVGGYNGAGLTGYDLDAIFRGMKLSKNSKYHFELITSTDNTLKLPKALEYVAEAERRFNNNPNWSISPSEPDKYFTGRIWIHEQTYPSTNKVTYRIDFKLYNGGQPNIIPAEISGLTAIEKIDYEDIMAKTVANMFELDKNANNPNEVPTKIEGSFSDVLNELFKPIQMTVDCIKDNPETVWGGFFRNDHPTYNINNLGWWEIGSQMLNLGLSMAGGSVPKEAYLPVASLAGKTPMIFDLGGGTAGAISGVFSLGKNAAVAVAFSSAGLAGTAAGGGLALVNAISSGSVKPIRDMFLPFVGPLETFKDQMQNIVASPPSNCEELSYETINASLTLVGDLILDAFGGKIIGAASAKLKQKVNILGTAAKSAAEASPKFVETTKLISDKIGVPINTLTTNMHMRASAWKNRNLKPIVLTTLLAIPGLKAMETDITNIGIAPEKIETTVGFIKHNDFKEKPIEMENDKITYEYMLNQVTADIAKKTAAEQIPILKDLTGQNDRPSFKFWIRRQYENVDDPNNKCTYCREHNQSLCRKLRALKIGTGKDQGVRKLGNCPLIALQTQPNSISDVILTQVIDEMNSWATPNMLTLQRAFLDDILPITPIEHIGANVSKIDLGIVQAWKAMTDAANIGTAFARDFPLLQKIKEVRTDVNKLTAFNYGTINGFQNFLAAYKIVPCNTCPLPGSGSLAEGFPKLDEIITNTLKGHSTHETKTGFLGFYAREPFAKDADYSKDGGQHMLKYLADKNFTNIAVGFDQNFIAGPYTNRQYDIFLGSNQPIRYIECKSYKETSELNTDKAVEQFIGYLSQQDLTSLTQLRYVFNGKKIDENQAKEKMLSIFKTNAIAIYNARPSLFTNIEITPGVSINSAIRLEEFANNVSLKDDFKSKILHFVIIHPQ